MHTYLNAMGESGHTGITVGFTGQVQVLCLKTSPLDQMKFHHLQILGRQLSTLLLPKTMCLVTVKIVIKVHHHLSGTLSLYQPSKVVDPPTPLKHQAFEYFGKYKSAMFVIMLV